MRQASARRLPAIALCAALGACSSGFTTVVPEPPPHYQSLGPAKGTACGSLGVVSTAYYVIPMRMNSRVERAYEAALTSVPGATGLVDVSYHENWYWWLIGTARCVTVTGEAVK